MAYSKREDYKIQKIYKVHPDTIQNEIKRDYFGFSSIVDKESTFLSNNNKSSVGFEYLSQLDLRSRHDNMQGEKGPLVYKKDERYRSFGLFFYNILKFKNRRIGDASSAYCSNYKLKKTLKWKPKYAGITHMINSAINWENNLNEKH